MKTKTSYFIMGLVGLGVIYWLYTIATNQSVVYPLTEKEAVVSVINQYPELREYQTTSLPPSSIKTQAGDEGWYVSFIREGSGIPGIIDAKCYHVGHQRDIAFVGEYKRENNNQVVQAVNLKTCEVITVPVVIPPSSTSTLYKGQKIGETKNFGSVSIKPISVEEDSRCPANANCVWAGRVRVKILVNGNESVVTLGEAFTTQNVVITLTEVLPQKTMTAIETSLYRFSFTVAKKSTPVATGKCYVGGCSGQICSDRPDAMSTCEYTEAYACYKAAACERQPSGQCGWTETASLRACLTK